MDVVRLASELIDINSESSELGVARYIDAYLKRIGIKSEVAEFKKGRANVIAQVGAGESLMLNGHTDTVPMGDWEGWRHGPEAVISGNRLYGCGASDMKGGLAAMLSALEGLDFGRARRGLLLAFVAGEETNFEGSRWLLGKRKNIFKNVKYGIIAEPTDMKLQIAQKGAIGMTVRFKGRSAHGSTPWLGVNAIEMATRFVNKLDELSSKFEVTDSILGKGTINVGKISGGTAMNVVPEYCEVEVDRRIVPKETLRGAIGQIKEQAKEAEASVEVQFARDAYKIKENEKVVRLVKSISRQRTTGTTGYTEAELYYKEAGIKSLVYGPGNKKTCHTNMEYVDIADLKLYRDVIKKVIRKWCFNPVL